MVTLQDVPRLDGMDNISFTQHQNISLCKAILDNEQYKDYYKKAVITVLDNQKDDDVEEEIIADQVLTKNDYDQIRDKHSERYNFAMSHGLRAYIRLGDKEQVTNIINCNNDLKISKKEV